MDDLKYFLELIFKDEIEKVIISNPRQKSGTVRKITLEAKKDGWQIAGYTEKQVFHENIQTDLVVSKTLELAQGNFRQINAFSKTQEHMLLISKKGSCNYKVNKSANDRIVAVSKKESHNRKKNYILQEGIPVPFLILLGIMTPAGKVISSKYDKFRQINRFLEFIDDIIDQIIQDIKNENSEKTLRPIHITDFGCGKSYLTFAVYHYLTEIKKIQTVITGLDLKDDVIKYCNSLAQKMNFSNLTFKTGNISDYEYEQNPDIIITLYACDTATDFAIHYAVSHNAKAILSVPCCQHEVNAQLDSCKNSLLQEKNVFSSILKYGILKERFSSLVTDAIRADFLEKENYKVQILEFIDIEHTPKNLLIRAVKKSNTESCSKNQAKERIELLKNALKINPSILLQNK